MLATNVILKENTLKLLRNYCSYVSLLWNMVLIPDKCHFLTLGFNKPFSDFALENTIIKNFTEEKILGIVINNNLNLILI